MIILIIIVVLFLTLIIYCSIIHHQIECQVNQQYILPSKDDLLKTHKIIWSYWDSKTKPLMVKVAQYTWYKHNPNYLICILSEDTLKNYLDISEFPKKYNECSIQRKADIIRLALLEKYGGFWLDATIVLNKPLDVLWDFNYDIGGYEADFFTTNPKKPVLENWFLSAPKNSPLIAAWKKEFYQAVDSNDYHLYIKEMEKTIDLQNIVGKVYLMMHCCFMKIIDKQNFSYKMFPAGKDNGPLAYLTKCDWNVLSATHLLLTSTDTVPPVIKLRGGERSLCNLFIYYMKKDSIIYRILYE